MMRWSSNAGQQKDVYFFCYDRKKERCVAPDKRRKYDEAFKAEARRLANESRNTQAAAQQLGISPKLPRRRLRVAARGRSGQRGSGP